MEHYDTNLNGIMTFPQHITRPNLRFDIVVCSDQGNEVVIGELSVPWEENIPRYDPLWTDIERKGWKFKIIPIESALRWIWQASRPKK